MTATQTTRRPSAAKLLALHDQAEAIDELRTLFPAGSTVSTVLRHRSSSGMSRSISVLHAAADGSITDVTWLVAKATGDKIDNNHGGIKVGGCGMDMGFHLVYSLSRVLYAGAFRCTGIESGPGRCPANDHSNERSRWVRREVTTEHADPVLYRQARAEGHAPAVAVTMARRGFETVREHVEPNYSTDRIHSDAGYALSHRWV